MRVPRYASARAAGGPTPGGTLALLGDRTRRLVPSCFHHFKARIEFVSAGHTANTIGLHGKLV